MRTTVNLLLNDVVRLSEACDKTGKGHSFLINECLRKYFTRHHAELKRSRIMRLVKYQPDGAGYCIVGLVFDVDVYNLAVNFRVFCRLSVSLMLTKALAEFLDELIYEIEGKLPIEHNYVEFKHLMRHNETYDCPEWQILWIVEVENTST